MARVFRLVVLISIICLTCRSEDCCDDPTDIVETEGGGASESFVLVKYGTDIRGVSALSDLNKQLAVGSDGVFLIFDGGQPTPVSLGIANDLNVVLTIDERIRITGDGIGGEPGVIYYFNGSSWREQSHVAQGDITGATRSGYVVSSDGYIMERSFSTPDYVEVIHDPGVHFTDIDGYTHHFAVGHGGVIYHYDGSTWEKENESGPDFTAVVVEETETAYAVGEGSIWNNIGGWHEWHSTTVGECLDIAGFDDTNETWVVGSNGMILHCRSNVWTSTIVGSHNRFNAIDIDWLSGGERQVSRIYVSGDNGATYSGDDENNWVDEGFANKMAWSDLHGFSETNVYATNGDTLMHWDGDSWSAESVHSDSMWALWCVDEDMIWTLGGEKGGIDKFAYFYNGMGWSPHWMSSFEVPHAIYAETYDRVFVAADLGIVRYYNGQYWEPAYVEPSSHDFFDIWGTSANNVFAVGDSGTVAHYDGDDWTATYLDTDEALLGVWGDGGSRVIALGINGVCAQFNGADWTLGSAGVTENLNAVCYLASSEVWAVGDDGVAVHYDGTNWLRAETGLAAIDLVAVWGNEVKFWIGGEGGYLLVQQ